MNIELRRFCFIATFLIASVGWSLAQQTSTTGNPPGNLTTGSAPQENSTPGAPQQDSTPAAQPQNPTTPSAQPTPDAQPQNPPADTQQQNPAPADTQQQNPAPANTQQQNTAPADTQPQAQPTQPADTQQESSSAPKNDKKSKSDSGPTGKVYVSVLPEEAYIWVDGKPMSHRSSLLKLPVGEHTIVVYNYGFVPKSQTVTVTGGERQDVTAHLEAVTGTVSGPWGRIQIEGVPGNSLVFMNGTTPEFFVGHADEMNNNFMTRQQLIVPAGTHQVTIVRRSTDQPIWSGQLEVKENKRLILYVKGNGKGDVVYKDWSHGKTTKDLKRFEAGTASATIVVAPVTGKLTADHDSIKCNEPVKLTWTSSEATVTKVTANNEKLADAKTGDLSVQPKQTTKYEFRAAGPGGTVVQDATVQVDPTITASLTPSAEEVRFVKVGDKVEEQATTDLKWTAENADSVTIDPLGTVTGASGTQNVPATPSQTNPGPVDETKTFKLTATNVCGGSETKTASVHVTGSIEPEQVAQAEPTPEPQLPATASPMPLLALFGLISLGSGAFLKLTKKK